MKTAIQQKFHAIDENLDHPPELKDLDDRLVENETKIETKASKAEIKDHIVDPMNTLNKPSNRMEIRWRTNQARNLERVTALEGKKTEWKTE